MDIYREPLSRTKDHSTLHSLGTFTHSAPKGRRSHNTYITVLGQRVPSSRAVRPRLCDQTEPISVTSLHPLYLTAPSSHPDVCLKENMTLADRLYNLQLIQDFCKDNLNGCCHFTLEDMLYASSTIKVLQHRHCIFGLYPLHPC